MRIALQMLMRWFTKRQNHLSDFTLNDQHGELVTKQQFVGQWNLVFLGYTSCPDICPLTLAKLNVVYKNLKADYPLQIWFSIG